MFQERLRKAIATARCGSRASPYSIWIWTGFKLVNDTRGHEIGDRLLVGVATAAAGQRARNRHGRPEGGDEFAIIQPSIASLPRPSSSPGG